MSSASIIDQAFLVGETYIDFIVSPPSDWKIGQNNSAELSVKLGGKFQVSRALSDFGRPHFVQAECRSSYANLFERFDSHYPLLSLSLRDTDEAPNPTVIIDEPAMARRTSFPERRSGVEIVPQVPDTADSIHLAYLDSRVRPGLETLSDWRRKDLFLSTDLCVDQPDKALVAFVLEALVFFDLLVCSGSEARAYSAKDDNSQAIAFLGRTVAGIAVVHEPDEVWVADGFGIHHVKLPEPRRGFSVLGAGDYFAGALIACLQGNVGMVEAVEIAARSATEAITLKRGRP